MRRPSIAIDVDDVIVSHVEAFIKYSNDHFGTNLTLDQYSDHWGVLWGIDDKGVKERAEQFHRGVSVSSYPMIESAKEALLKLRDTHDLYIATARPEYLVSETRSWVDNQFPGVFSEVHFVPIWLDDAKTKAVMCQEIGADFLIDDAIGHCNTAAKAGIKTILFGDYSWNNTTDIEEGIIRCNNWQEVLDYFDTHKKKSTKQQPITV